MKKVFVLCLFIMLGVVPSFSQGCAMCKKSAEDAGGINEGIIYMMVFPYIVLSEIGFVIYRKYKKNKNS